MINSSSSFSLLNIFIGPFSLMKMPESVSNSPKSCHHRIKAEEEEEVGAYRVVSTVSLMTRVSVFITGDVIIILFVSCFPGADRKWLRPDYN